MHVITTPLVHSFYTASLVVLRFLDSSSTGRRVFGPEADARWKGFQGDLELQDRIDLAVRDGAVRWGAAFSPSRVFQLTGLAADEPFGPDWPGLDSDAARKVWREVEGFEPTAPDAGMNRIAAAWSLKLAPVEVGDLKPATKVLVAGPSAVAATMTAFIGREDLSWADQVVVAGSSPVERHLGGLAAPLLGSRGATRLTGPEEARARDKSPAACVREAGISAVDKLVVSDDASPAARDFARAAADSLR